MKKTTQSRTVAGTGREAPDQYDTSKTIAKEKEPRQVEHDEAEKHEGFYKGPQNQTLKAGHGERKEHEDHHPAVKMAKGN